MSEMGKWHLMTPPLGQWSPPRPFGRAAGPFRPPLPLRAQGGRGIYRKHCSAKLWNKHQCKKNNFAVQKAGRCNATLWNFDPKPLQCNKKKMAMQNFQKNKMRVTRVLCTSIVRGALLCNATQFSWQCGKKIAVQWFGFAAILDLVKKLPRQCSQARIHTFNGNHMVLSGRSPDSSTDAQNVTVSPLVLLAPP